MVVNFRNSADAEPNDTSPCDQNERYERLMVDCKRGDLDRELTNEHDPTITNPTYKTAIAEALDEQGEREAAPSADEVSRQLPKEDGDGSASAAGHSARQNEEASEGRAWRVHLIHHAELEDEHEAYQCEGVETNQEE